MWPEGSLPCEQELEAQCNTSQHAGLCFKMSRWPRAQLPSWRTTTWHLSAKACSVYSQRPSISGGRLIHPQPDDRIGSGGKTPRIFNLGTRRTWVVSFILVAIIRLSPLRLCEPTSRSGRRSEEKNYVPTGNRNPVLHPVASNFTDFWF